MSIDRTWLSRAEQEALKSKDPSTKVGAILFGRHGFPLARGHNHLPRGTDPAIWENREEKYKRVVHAEISVLMQAGESSRGGTLYVTHFPCNSCAGPIISANVKRVVTWYPDTEMLKRWWASMELSKQMLEAAGVEVTCLNKE